MKVLVRRDYNGIGDWLMALACLKMLNRQRPDVEAYVQFETKTRLPHIVPQAFAESDVRLTVGVPTGEYKLAHNLVYRKWPPDSYLESMVHNLNDLCGLDVRYEHGVYPRFSGADRWDGGYVALISQGKRIARGGKEWGFANFTQLARHLKRHARVVQIGSRFDKPIPSADQRFLGSPFREMARALAGASVFVGIENGMMVLAGFLGVPQVTVYDGWAMGVRSDYPVQTKLLSRVEPDQVAETVIKQLGDVSAAA